MKQANDFSRIAFAYDILAGFIFLGFIRRSQINTFQELRPGSRVLILGGGTGWILEELDKLDVHLKIDFVEPSEKMMNSAKKRFVENLEVNYLDKWLGPKSEWYDHVMAFYFLDLFSERSLEKILIQIRESLAYNGRLHFADFEFSDGQSRFWQKWLSILMHNFFRLTVNLESTHLKPLNTFIVKAGFTKESENYYFGNFICSRVYVRI